MKRVTRTLALLAVLSTLAVSCQKENMETPVNGAAVEQTYAENSVIYSIDGQMYTASFSTPEGKKAFILQLMAVARQGHVVTLHSTQATQALAKEKVVYKTKDANDAAIWCSEMEGSGYNVTVTYDPSTGIYTCVAIR